MAASKPVSATQLPDKVVTITMQNGIPVPDQDPVVVKRGNQRLRWIADFDFQISIDGYDDVRYTASGEQRSCKTGDFGEERRYKYTISANGIDNDPNIDIKP